MQSTKVKCKCTAKTQRTNYDPKHPYSYEIRLEVPYDPNSIFYQMSGGTTPILNTVNEEAAKMFEVGKSYDIVISPSED
jgi:hypothetical protein